MLLQSRNHKPMSSLNRQAQALVTIKLYTRGRERMAREPGVALLMIAYGSLR